MIDAPALSEAALRTGFFVGIFALMAGWEALAPLRQRVASRSQRWGNNLALVALDSVIVRLIFPVTAVGFAALAAERGWGLTNLLGLPYWPALIVSLLLLDLIIYLQHRLFHAVPLLWRLHRVHHADTELDVTTALRRRLRRPVRRQRRCWSSKWCSTARPCSTTPTSPCHQSSSAFCGW
jgi:sterol desaturase/sphingolipid hydroxylase (fatty acid hydroxylase superfamily)